MTTTANACFACGGDPAECDCGGEGSEEEDRGAYDPRPDPRAHPEYWTE